MTSVPAFVTPRLQLQMYLRDGMGTPANEARPAVGKRQRIVAAGLFLQRWLYTTTLCSTCDVVAHILVEGVLGPLGGALARGLDEHAVVRFKEDEVGGGELGEGYDGAPEFAGMECGSGKHYLVDLPGLRYKALLLARCV